VLQTAAGDRIPLTRYAMPTMCSLLFGVAQRQFELSSPFSKQDVRIFSIYFAMGC
jgi:hypothetical protein